MPSIVAAMMRPVRQPVVIADQFAMKLNRVLNRFAALPVIFAKSSLNSELRFNQITPRLSFLIQDVTNAESFIDALEIVTGELAAVVRDHVFPKPPTQQRLEVDVQDHADFLPGRERTGEDGPGEALQQHG